jgi:hypothetical protein
MKAFNYEYSPGILDRITPTVIRGKAIATSARVRIAREFNPPMYPTKVFCMIEDVNGNVQSVYKKAVCKRKPAGNADTCPDCCAAPGELCHIDCSSNWK